MNTNPINGRRVRHGKLKDDGDGDDDDSKKKNGKRRRSTTRVRYIEKKNMSI